MSVCFAVDCNHNSMRETCKFFQFPSDKHVRECRRWPFVSPMTAITVRCEKHASSSTSRKTIASVVYGLMLAGLSCLAQLSNVFISLLEFTCISVRNYVCLCRACRKTHHRDCNGAGPNQNSDPSLNCNANPIINPNPNRPPTLNSGCLVAQMPFQYAGIMTLQKP